MWYWSLVYVITWTIKALSCWILSKLSEIDLWPINEIDFLSWITLPIQPPAFWLYYRFAEEWTNHIDSNGHPDRLLAAGLIEVVWQMWYTNIEQAVYWGRDKAVELVRSFVGWVGRGFLTFQAWVDDIDQRVDTWLPFWSDTVAWGLHWLYKWFPDAVTTGVQWLDWLFQEVVIPLRNWAKDRYDDARDQASEAFAWVLEKGFAVYDWFLNVAEWTIQFIANPYITILNYLGLAWQVWDGFWSDPVGFICSYWGLEREDVANFFDHPGLWLTGYLTSQILQGSLGLIEDIAEVARKVLVALW